MIRIYADSKAEPVRCTNRRRGIWRITWDYQETETAEGGQRSYMEETFDHLPALAEIKAVINEWYNPEDNRHDRKRVHMERSESLAFHGEPDEL